MPESPSPGTPQSPEGTASPQTGQTGEPPQWTWLARIRRPQGRKGEVFADILTDFPEKFADRRRLWLLPASPATAQKPTPKSEQRPHSSALGFKSSSEAKKSVSGHDFSRAENASKNVRALAPAGNAKGYQEPREVTLTNHWLHKGAIILHFSGINSISDAETLAGLIVAIPQTERAPLAEDEAYIGDLIGCSLVDVAQTPPANLGAIEDVDRTAGPVALLVVKGVNGEILIPFAKSYLRKIDLAAHRVEMSLPEGLADLNASEQH